jgi:hypothetical protein
MMCPSCSRHELVDGRCPACALVFVPVPRRLGAGPQRELQTIDWTAELETRPSARFDVQVDGERTRLHLPARRREGGVLLGASAAVLLAAQGLGWAAGPVWHVLLLVASIFTALGVSLFARERVDVDADGITWQGPFGRREVLARRGRLEVEALPQRRLVAVTGEGGRLYLDAGSQTEDAEWLARALRKALFDAGQRG